jgi:PAS domain S-box-containing protein
MSLPEHASLIDALFEAAPVGMAVFDTSYRFMRINPLLADLNGLSVAAHLGRPLREVLPGIAEAVEPVLARVLATGIAERDIPIVGETPGHPGVVRQWRASYLPLEVEGQRAVASYVEERTEQVAAERALRASEQEFRAIAEALPLGLLLSDPAGRIVYGNPAAATILGMTVDAASEPGWQTVIHPDDLPRVIEGVQRAIAQRGIFESEHRHVLPTGRLVWVRTRSFGIHEGDVLRRFVTVLEDVTIRRADADALRASELRFRTICEAAPLGIFFNDADGHLLYANPAAGELLGRPEAELFGADWGVALHPDDMSRVIAAGKDAERRGLDGFEVHARVVRPDGGVSWVEAQIRELYDGNRRIGRLSLTTDVTERRRILAALYESEALFRELSDNIDAVFYLAHPDSDGLDFVSRGFSKVWGRSVEELATKPGLWLEAIHPDDRPRVVEVYERDRAHFRAEYRVVRPDKSVRWVSDRSFPVRDAAGTIVRIAGIATDETDRRTLEAQLLQAQRLESIGRLAGGVAHDFNNMLTVIMSHAAFARMDPMNADEDLGSIERAGRRAAELTGQLLAFARRQVIEPRIVDLNALTGQIDRMLRRLLGEQVLLQTQLHPELWPVKVDPAQMEQVLVNLAVNARDAMPMGGTLTLETANVVLDAGYVAVHADVVAGEYVMVAVSDNGEGIDPAFLPMIFEPFFTTKPNGAGTGLGLATCYGIIKQAGGHIWAYSEPGRGATFKLYLPRAEGEASELTIASPATTARGDETVLLVEDDADVRAIGVRALRGTGFRVLEAADGVDALAIARAFEGTIHILVTDVVMPRMGGKELAAQLAAERPEMKVLFASGYTRNAIVHQGVLEQGTNFLQKPYVPAGLVKKVREVIDG